jgi:hypothetical protein
MPNYNVSVKNSNYNVLSGPQKKYNIGVNYEIPSKYLQYGNEVLDDISSDFDGTTTIFDLKLNSVVYTPVNDQQLIVSINGLMQTAGVDYTVSNNQIVFTNPPASSDSIYIVALSTTADLTRTINFIHDSGSQDMITGTKGSLTLDVTGRIQSWTVTSEQIGSITLDVRKSSFEDYPNVISICGTDRPFLNNQNKNRNLSLSTWQSDIFAGDILQFEVLSAQNIRRFVLSLKLFL